MKKLLFLTTLLLLSRESLAQYTGPFTYSSRDFESLYADLIGDDEEIFKTWYHYVVTKKGENYILRQFNPERKQLYSETVFSDKKLKTKHGPYREFDFDGGGYISGIYSNNKRVGVWKGYYLDGTLRTSTIYLDGQVEGESKAFYPSGQLKKITKYEHGKMNGRSETYFENGQQHIIENYSDDKLNGDYLEYDSLGVLINHWVYSNMEVKEYKEGKAREDIQPKPFFSGCGPVVDSEAYRKCQIAKMYQHIASTISYPRIEQKFNVSGRVFIKFVVEKNGEIKETEILKGLTDAMNNESIRVIKSMSPWTPGYREGNPARVWFTMPILFQLE